MSPTRPPRVYIPGAIPEHGVYLVPPEQAHHLAHVLRLGAGDAVVAFDGRGHEYAATVARVSKSGIALTLGEGQPVDRESPLAVTLAQGISAGDRMDYTVQKAVELGVDSIQPLAVERSVVRLTGERAAKRVAHWQAVAAAACEQCGRNRVPQVLPIAGLAAWLGALPLAAARLTLSPGAPLRFADIEKPAGAILLLVGPEGGLTPREHETAVATGFTALRIGPRVLRTETAAVAALAAIQTLWGDF